MSNFDKSNELSKAKPPGHWFKGRATTVAMVVGCFLIAGVVFLKVGLSGLGNSLIFLLLLACPLLHFLMHRGHGSGDNHDHRATSAAADSGKPKN